MLNAIFLLLGVVVAAGLFTLYVYISDRRERSKREKSL